jgi:monoamine oxidase
LSALYVLRQYALLRNDAGLYKIQGGMDRLPRAMAAALGSKVQYGAAVTRIDPAADRVTVEYRSGARRRTIAARRVVLTMPTPVLRRIATADAALQARFDLLAGIPYFPATRFLVETHRRSWHDEGLNGSARTDRPAELWDCAYDADGNPGLLGATAGGIIGDALNRQSRAEAIRMGVSVVTDAFPDARVKLATTYRWGRDQWAGGAFAVFRPGQMLRIMPAASRPIGRIHFAGEHTATWMGWAEGALQSAERVMGEVLA